MSAAAAALTATENRWMVGGVAIAAVTAAALAGLILRSGRMSRAVVGYGGLAAVASVACGAIIGWLAAPYTPDGTLNDLAAAFGGGGGFVSVLFGAYLWGPVAGLGIVAWGACREAAVRGRAGAMGLTAAVLGVVMSALSLTLSDRPAVTTVIALLGCVAGAVAVAAELSARA